VRAKGRGMHVHRLHNSNDGQGKRSIQICVYALAGTHEHSLITAFYVLCCIQCQLSPDICLHIMCFCFVISYMEIVHRNDGSQGD
jgi:hypothetical protein